MRTRNASDKSPGKEALPDDAPRLQAALDAPGHHLRIRPGTYRLRTPLTLPDGARIEAEPGAVLVADGIPWSLATRGGPPSAPAIAIRGGVWRGAGFRLSFVRGLCIEDTTFRDTPRALRLDHVDGYRLSRLALEGDNGGLLFAGCCRDGHAAGIDASRARLTGPCLLFSTDGDGLPHGPIENAAFREIIPPSYRFESDGSTIRNLEFTAKGTSPSSASFSEKGHFDNIVIDGAPHSSQRQDRKGDRFPSKVLLEPGLFLVTSSFGPRVHPVTGEVSSMHQGVDGALWDGRMLVETGICAWRAGVVIAAEESDGPAGTHVAIDHGNGLVSRYFHMEPGSLRVSAGDQVEERALLGWMGTTGRSTGEHLHFQLEEDGVPIDPMEALRERSREETAL